MENENEDSLSGNSSPVRPTLRPAAQLDQSQYHDELSTTIFCFDDVEDTENAESEGDHDEDVDKEAESKEDDFLKAPSRDEILKSLSEFDIPAVRYERPFFSNPSDKPDKLVGFQSDTVQTLEAWPGKSWLEEKRKQAFAKIFGEASENIKLEAVASEKLVTLQTTERPPTRAEVEDWLRVRAAMKKIREKKEKVKPERVKRKILIRENSDDSEGSEMSCSQSPVSSPRKSPDNSPNNSPNNSPSKSPSPCPSSTGSSPIPPSPEAESSSLLQKDSKREENAGNSTTNVKPVRHSRLRSRHSRTSVLEQSFRSSKEDEKVESDIIFPSQVSSQDTSYCMNTSSIKAHQAETKAPEPTLKRRKSILKRKLSDDMFASSPELHPDTQPTASETPDAAQELDTSHCKQNAAEALDTTPALKPVTRLQARKRLKRRISWQLPQQENEHKCSQPRSGESVQDDTASNTLSGETIADKDCDADVTADKSCSNESTLRSSDESSAIAQSILDKLNDTETMKGYLTPKQAKESMSYVEPVSSGESPAPLIDLQSAAKALRNDHLSMLVMELLCQTRGQLLPDPLVDPIQGVFYSIVRQERTLYGCILVSPNKEDLLKKTGITGWRVRYVESEEILLKHVVRLIRDSDPDILAGYEIQMESWGLLFQRAFHLGVNLCPLMSRIPDSVRESKMSEDEDNPGAQYNADHTSEITLVGRIIFNSWRILRSELALTSYTLENVSMSVLGKRIPHLSHQVLTRAWSKHTTRYKTAHYMVQRLEIHNEIMSRLDLLSRTSELARLFGIQFYEVISRGSQFRVESSMLRLAKPRNYVPVSPTRQQLAAQAAPEYLALLLEPESRMYDDPVIVLDFQSLYPSIIIGYNYCYSTCLGRVENMSSPGIYSFGCTQLQISPERLEALRGDITISPGGIVFLKKSVRRGVLPQMLEDILNTRIMVKQSMKKHGKDPDLQKILHSRQLGLKLIANVTYGYTSANFSGRMPCIEVGDSVVSKAREALETTIRTIESRPEWGGKVVYGDTDSVFVLLKGKTKDEAFDIGEEIAKVITDMNPKPMKLKFEKVYLPCILQTKKRYVGYMYETRNQQKPVFDAKGIETVRRDGIPATVKILEKSIRILFETKDISQVKSYVQSQFMKIISGSLSIQDLTFAKEFRGLQGYRPSACVPALELTKTRMKKDRRKIPRTGERVPYIIVYGEPGLPLIQLVRDPQDVLFNSELRPNAQYYITKVIIPPLNRCMLLVGIDTLSWFSQLPRISRPVRESNLTRRGVISKYFVTQSCASCGKFTMSRLCDNCRLKPDRTGVKLAYNLQNMENDIKASILSCVKCSGEKGTECISLDCPQFYRRINAFRKEDEIRTLTSLLEEL